jgi:hypothetical protein
MVPNYAYASYLLNLAEIKHEWSTLQWIYVKTERKSQKKCLRLISNVIYTKMRLPEPVEDE